MRVSALFPFSFFIFTSLSAQASWYWPFGEGEAVPPRARLSELMEPATTNIDAAADFAAEGKYKEAQDCYRAAIAALEKIEADNPERATTPEFATVRNKRAYINAALDAILLEEARENAKSVAVTDTTELEVKLALKPWKEFLPTYDALTNADRLVVKRLAFVESPWARELQGSAAGSPMREICVSNCNAVGTSAAWYADRRDELAKAYREASAAVRRLERFSETASSSDGARVFDVCKKDVRTSVASCQKIWPKVGEALDKLNANLEGLRGVMQEIAAWYDFPEIATNYVAKIGGDLKAVEETARDTGYSRACETMLGELDAAAAGVVHHGALYKLCVAWGGEETDVPTKDEDDDGLVKDDGDVRPEVECQIDAYMEKERKHHGRVKKEAEKKKAQKDVQHEVKRLLKKDAKSRKARLLMAGEDLRNGDTAAAAKVKALLDEKPNDCSALNMRAAIEAAEGDLAAAEKTLDQAIQSNPRDYHAYYNMANVFLERGNVDGARRYYETGRSFAGPKDAAIEKAVMHK